MKNRFRYVPLLILIIVLSLNIGFAVFGEELLVSDISATVRIKADVRVTGVVPNGGTNEAISNSEDYNVKDLLLNFCLPQGDSTITYKVEVTNFGNTDMGISDITNLPDGLTYEIDNGVLKEPICDNNGKCTLGAVKEFNITLKYIDNTATSNTCFNADLAVDFQRFYTVTYINAPRGNNYKTKVLGNTEFQQTGVPAGGGVITYTNSGTKISGATYNLTNKFFTVGSDKVIDDITVTFRPLGEFIIKEYTDGTKGTFTHNSITYNRVTSLGLYNDRKGGNVGVNEGNVRYYGANPNNYIYFNCSDYDNQSDSTCEKWRIIGVFDNKVKITRNASIGSYSWDRTANKWSTSATNKLLNSGFDNESVNNSLYWNAKSGKCYNGGNTSSTTSCNFTSTGLKNADTRNFITTETLYFYSPSGLFGGVVHFEAMYKQERGEGDLYSANDGNWNGKISLIYTSDYYYSTDLSNSSCNTQMYWIRTGCSNTSFMKQSSDMWTITPGASSSTTAWYVKASGQIANEGVSNTNTIIPTLYLDVNTIFMDGNGSSSNPYKIYPLAS